MPVVRAKRPATTSPSPRILALLDAMPDASAMLDPNCEIVAVNHAWRMFSVDNGGDPERTGAGINYLAVCEQAASDGCADGAIVAEGLRSVLRGESVESEYEYACPSPAVGRWYALRITRITGPQHGLLISHVNITRRKMAEHDLIRKASEDPLTRLPNRELFLERLAHSLTPRVTRQRVGDVGVAFVDLDKFKPVNDTYGHAAGDEVLQNAAARLATVTRPQDTIARLGGDEFAVVAPRINAEGLAGLASRITRTLSEPYLVHGRTVIIGASVGTYLAKPGELAADCLHHADSAMYDQKRRGAGRP